jgi:hypothetical protein
VVAAAGDGEAVALARRDPGGVKAAVVAGGSDVLGLD